MNRQNRQAIICVTNDLVADQRIIRHGSALKEAGWEVTFIGRKRRDRIVRQAFPFPHKYLPMFFGSGFLFYAEYNIRLFLHLLAKGKGLVVANDLDTLPAVWYASRFRRYAILYDSHEYFTGVPELLANPFARGVWEFFESRILPRLNFTVTVNRSIADMYREAYGVEMTVVRNVPPPPPDIRKKTRKELSLPEDKHILILQGTGINVDRGGDEAVEAMRDLEDVLLLIIGSGDRIPYLKARAKELKVEERVRFIDRLPYEELYHYTAQADIGLSLDKNTSLNHMLSLPNKLFDYIRAGIPVLASPMKEVRLIVEGYDVGCVVETTEVHALAEKIRWMLSDNGRTLKWKENLKAAQGVLNWDREKRVYVDLAGRAAESLSASSR